MGGQARHPPAQALFGGVESIPRHHSSPAPSGVAPKGSGVSRDWGWGISQVFSSRAEGSRERQGWPAYLPAARRPPAHRRPGGAGEQEDEGRLKAAA